MRRTLTMLVATVIAFIGLAFAVLNAESVELKYYLGSFTLPLALLLAITLLIGAILGGVASIGIALRQRHENGRLRKRMAILEAELKSLGGAPSKERA